MPKRSRHSRRGKRATHCRRKCCRKGTRKYKHRGGFDVKSKFYAPGNYIMDKIDRALAGGRKRRTRHRRHVKRSTHRRRRR